MNLRLAFLLSRLRIEEKLLLQEFQRRGVQIDRLDDRRLSFGFGSEAPPYDLLFDRSLSFGRSQYLVRAFESAGVPCLNRSDVILRCGDKAQTHFCLTEAGLPMPKTRMAFTPESALEALDQLGYPAVLKPVVGSWGRLVARLNDRDAAEAVLEDRATLGHWSHQAYYLQEWVDKPERDLRVFVIGTEPICAIYRYSPHWITNTARGGRALNCEIDLDLRRLSTAAARAIGGGLLAIDLVETRAGELQILEVNHSMEFRNSVDVTGVDIPARMVDFVLERARGLHSDLRCSA